VKSGVKEPNIGWLLHSKFYRNQCKLGLQKLFKNWEYSLQCIRGW